jgi:hypothetical protein
LFIVLKNDFANPSSDWLSNIAIFASASSSSHVCAAINPCGPGQSEISKALNSTVSIVLYHTCAYNDDIIEARFHHCVSKVLEFLSEAFRESWQCATPPLFVREFSLEKTKVRGLSPARRGAKLKAEPAVAMFPRRH